ncbi:uncharacterized protein [Chiloscyllium punctatum]|uniref:uncharacterized protein n=1 Tax=Chiloscyllium punctatum TaxID=137246 RepID=UPI003B640E12
MDVSALYTSIPHNDGIAATASVFNTNNCQSPNTILQLIRFILDHNVFTFDNQFFIQTHGTAMGTNFALQYANIFMHRFEQDFFSMQDLKPTLYTRYTDDIFFLLTHGEESLIKLHSDINKFHPTIKLTIDYSRLSVSFLDTCVSIKDRYLSPTLFRKPTDNLTMLHFSSFHPKHIKTSIPYGQALHIHQICSDEEGRDGHLEVLKDALTRTGYDAQLIDRKLRRATARNRNDLLRRQTHAATDRARMPGGMVHWGNRAKATTTDEWAPHNNQQTGPLQWSRTFSLGPSGDHPPRWTSRQAAEESGRSEADS